MQEWQTRVVNELKELRERTEALGIFIQTDSYKNLDIQNQILLDQQLQAMIQYGDILTQRIQLFNFDGKPSLELQTKIGNLGS